MKRPVAARLLLPALLLTPLLGAGQSYLQQTFEPGANTNPAGTRTQLVYTPSGATSSNANTYTGTLAQATVANNANVAPLTANVYSQGAYGYGVVNNKGGGTESVTLTFDAVTFPVTSGNYLTFRLASFATNNNGGIDNGAGNGVLVQIAYNGSGTFTNTLDVRGVNQGSVFDFNATGSAGITVNAAPGAATVVNSPNDLIGNTGTVPAAGIGYSTIRVNFGPAITSVQVRLFISASTKTAIFIDDVRIGSNGPLPVELTAFTAQRQAAGVLLKWATASEKNNARFEVERSADGRDFQPIATVAGHGSTTQAHTYSLTDQRPLPGLAYYRLRQVDTEGTFTYSPVRAVATGLAAALYPNPAREVLYLPAGAGGLPYQVLNGLGQTLDRGIVPDNGRIGVGQLPAGSYLLQTGAGLGRVVQRFLRQE